MFYISQANKGDGTPRSRPLEPDEDIRMDKVKGRRQQHRRRSKQSEIEDDKSGNLKSSAQSARLIKLVADKDWETLLYCVLKEPHTASVKFTENETNSSSAGNLVLHEVCKKNPPKDIFDALIEANEEAVKTKGNSGFYPLHYACAYGASSELIRTLHSKFPGAASVKDEEEGVLPLHLACMAGCNKEEVFMCLLSSYPEGAKIRDDFGKLPLDYAKNIQSDSYRKTAIDCLKRAKWFEKAAKFSKESTEVEFHERIKGYEQAQVQHLKMIEEVHKKEVSNLEEGLETEKHESLKRKDALDELDKHMQEMTDKFRERTESLEKSMKVKNRKLQEQVEMAKEETSKIQNVFDIKIKESAELSQQLDNAKVLSESLRRQLKERTEELDLALEDIETFSKHSKWLESVVQSIRDLTNSESPLLPKNETSTKSLSLKSIDSASVCSRRSRGISRSKSRKNKDSASVCSRKSRGISRSLSRTRKNATETREPSLVRRAVAASRE